MTLSDANLTKLIEHLRIITVGLTPPMTETIIQEYGKNPYLILISCLLSLRARDVVTIHICRALFSRIQTPQELCALPLSELETIIYKSGFYKNKARTLRAVSTILIERHKSMVPETEEELLALPGVGQKTTNLVLGLAFDIPAICVDTHVHKLSNQWGLVNTRTADETEKALKKVLPAQYWIEWNRLLVMIGQNKKVLINRHLINQQSLI
jgi:endonuclease-3